MNPELQDAIRTGTVAEIRQATRDSCRDWAWNAVTVAETIAEAIVAERESRVPSSETIDSVCVGLAECAMGALEILRRTGLHGMPHHKRTIPGEYGLLCLLLGIPEPMPDWATSALETHQDTPENLVKALRQMAAMEGEPSDLEIRATSRKLGLRPGPLA